MNEQKTIRLKNTPGCEDFALENGVFLEVNADAGWNLTKSEYQIGTRGVLIRTKNVRTGRFLPLRLNCSPKAVEEGIPGNSNPAITRHYGWRGTTNDISVHADGVWEVKSIKINKKGDAQIKIERVD